MGIENPEKYLELTVEELVKIIFSNNIEREDFIEAINTMNSSSEDFSKLKMKVDFAYERINKSLNLTEIIINFFIPFGIFWDGVFKIYGLQEFTKFRERGYLKKAREAGMISLLGSSFYLIVFLLILK